MKTKNLKTRYEMVLMMEKVAPKDTSGCSCFHKLHFVKATFTPERAGLEQNFEITNINDSDWQNPEITKFHDFIFRVWISWNTYSGVQSFSADSWEMLFDSPYSVGLKEAERMFKLLKKVNKISDAAYKTGDRPKTFGEFVVAMCKALKVKYLVQLVGTDRGHFYSDNKYELQPIADAAAKINDSIQEVRKVYAPATIPQVVEIVEPLLLTAPAAEELEAATV